MGCWASSSPMRGHWTRSAGGKCPGEESFPLQGQYRFPIFQTIQFEKYGRTFSSPLTQTDNSVCGRGLVTNISTFVKVEISRPRLAVSFAKETSLRLSSPHAMSAGTLLPGHEKMGFRRSFLVPGRGLEPPRLSAYPPQG